MARMKSLQSIEAEIAKTEEELSKIQARYDSVAAQLSKLQKQKREYEAKEIMEAYEQSGKSFAELMTFLQG